jgi:hypothetical protein
LCGGRGGFNTATRKSEFEIKEEQEIMNREHIITNEEVEHSPKDPFFISPPSSLKEGSVVLCGGRGGLEIGRKKSKYERKEEKK